MAGQSAGSQDKLRLFVAPSIAGSDAVAVAADAIGVNVVAVVDAIGVNVVAVADATGVDGVVSADGIVVGQLLLNPALVPVSDPHRICSWVQLKINFSLKGTVA
jgi:hypothetical protein